VNVPLILAGVLAILGAAIHGAAGEVLVVRKLSPAMLPASRFGGPRTTKTMIHVTWHMTTVAFLTVGSALLLSGLVLDGDTAHGIAVVAAGGATGLAAVTVGLGAAYARSPRSLLRHPASALLIATAALAWWGVASGP
jgi:Mrp family chromosome partitioning ATPase